MFRSSSQRSLPWLLLGFFVLLAGFAQAQPGLKAKSRKVIRRTHYAMNMAREQVKIGKNYTGHLKRAYSHQAYAVRLHKLGRYPRAISHSRRARMLAFRAMELNKGKVPSQYVFEDDESAPQQATDEELDAEIKREVTDGPATDQAAINEVPATVGENE